MNPPFFYSIYIFLENSNHMLSTDLCSLPLVYMVRLLTRALRLGGQGTGELVFVHCNPLLSVTKNMFLMEEFASLHPDIWLPF